jgi:hypothetical protein
MSQRRERDVRVTQTGARETSRDRDARADRMKLFIEMLESGAEIEV